MSACDCEPGENCGPCCRMLCANALPCNLGVPGSDYEENCGYELCAHGKCVRCDGCSECQRESLNLLIEKACDENDINF